MIFVVLDLRIEAVTCFLGMLVFLHVGSENLCPALLIEICYFRVKFLEDRLYCRYYLEISPLFCDNFGFDSKNFIGTSIYG